MQTQLPPAPSRPPVQWRLVALIVLPIAIVMAVGYGINMAQEDNAADAPAPVAQQSTAVEPPKSPVDAAALARYWSDNFSSADWYALASGPDWDGHWLSVTTKLYADSDAKAPATAMCAALSGYWITSGKAFHAVRVLDKAGNVLVSRHSMAEQCTWRR